MLYIKNLFFKVCESILDYVLFDMKEMFDRKHSHKVHEVYNEL